MSTPKVEDQLRILNELETQIAELRARFQSTKEEAKVWAEKRDALNAQSKKIWEEAKDLRARRDELNERIKKLKEERTKLHAEVAPKREELEALKKKMDELPGRTGGNARSIAKRIEELDWEIQTNPLTLAEEKELVGRIKVLEEQMIVCKDAEAVRSRLLELRSEFGSLKITANDIHEKITELAKQSQELHEKMLAKIKEAETIRPEADEAHKKYSSLRSQADEAYGSLVEAAARAKAIGLQVRQERENEERRRVEAALATGSEEAMRKLKEKRKITLDEFKILKSKGLI